MRILQLLGFVAAIIAAIIPIYKTHFPPVEPVKTETKEEKQNAPENGE